MEFPNVSVTHCQPHINSSETDLREQIPEIMGKLKAEDWQLVFIYYEDVDHQGHRGGPHSGAVKESLMRVSDIVGSLQVR